jgi:biopolymer transport protein ExbB
VLSIIQAAGWPIWPLIACSIMGVALVIERFLSLQTRKVAPPQLLDEAILVSQRGVPKRELIEQLQHNSVLGEVLASGLTALSNMPHISVTWAPWPPLLRQRRSLACWARSSA